MILERTYDDYLLKAVMTHDEMWARINVNGSDVEDFDPAIGDKMTAVCVIEGDEVLGLHIFTDRAEAMAYHPMLLSPYRKQYSREFLESGLKWYFENTEYDFLEAEIPADSYAHLNLARHYNFREVGMENNLKILRLDK